MPTITFRFFNDEHIQRWEKLEKAGKLGARNAPLLKRWRELKAKHPAMKTMMAYVHKGVLHTNAMLG